MTSELTVVVKDEEKTLRKKHLAYETYEVSEDDRFISDCVKATIKEFDGEPSDVDIIIKMSIR